MIHLMKNHKGFISIPIIIGLLFVIVVGGYFAFRTKVQTPVSQKGSSTSTIPQADTAGWQTYTNDQYGFEVEYPSNYQVSDKLEEQGFYDYQISKIADFSVKENYIDNSTFTVYADNGKSNIDECTKDADGKDLMQMENINGNDYYVFWKGQGDAAMGGARGLLNQYRIVHNGYCYILDSHVYWHEVGYAGVINTGKSSATPEDTQGQNSAIQMNAEILDKMLSTFKFISPVPSVSAGLISVASPSANEIVSSPVSISGTAKAGWGIFEGQAGTVNLYDGNGNGLGMAVLKVSGDWTQPEVQFTASLNFSSSESWGGKLVFKNDNPSGDPTRDKTYEVDVKFGKN